MPPTTKTSHRLQKVDRFARDGRFFAHVVLEAIDGSLATAVVPYRSMPDSTTSWIYGAPVPSPVQPLSSVIYLGESDRVVGPDLVLLASVRADRSLAPQDVEEAVHILWAKMSDIILGKTGSGVEYHGAPTCC